jgi:3D (Asp-Asp-Asp) domain-containing protein
MTVTVPSGRRTRTKLIWLVPAFGFVVLLAPVVLLAGAGNPPCTSTASSPTGLPVGSGPWVATAYGPPWDAINGSGVTATGLNLTAGQPAYEIAVDPSVIPLRSFAHVSPNPFRTPHAFYAGDTGGAIIGRHVDIYDWQGRAAQDAWGVRHVTVTPAPNPGTGNLLGEITPTVPSQPASATTSTTGCTTATGGPLPLTPGQQAKILPSGLAAAPQNAPSAVKHAIAAGNQLVGKPYLYGGGHGQPLSTLAPAYDCSGATSYILHAAGILGLHAEDSTELESYGQPGPGAWITVYANSGHVFIAVAGVVMNTAWYAAVQPTTPSSGPRWQPASTIAAQYAGDQYGGFVQRHPQGL